MPKPAAPPPPGPVGDFARYLRGLLIQAGKPDYAQMRRATGYARSALSAAFAGKKPPTWELAERLVRFLRGNVDEAHRRWAIAKKPQPEPASAEDQTTSRATLQRDFSEQDNTSPPEPQQSVLVPRQLPMDVPDFTGRTSEIAKLDAFLAQDTHSVPTAVVISAIDGTAGVGKTALAVHWAHRVRDRFPDGQLYINLRGYDPGPPVSPEEALDILLRALNVPAAQIPTRVEAQAALYRSLLVGRNMLVVLDNAATPQQVRPLLPGSSGCRVVVTSRSSLSGLVIREGAVRITLDALAPEEAVMLLRQVIGPARVDADPRSAAELARSCAFLPLALRIAGERAASHPHAALADLVRELTDEHDRLDVLAVDDETATVRAVFSWSYQSLPPTAARLFRLLSLHTGPDISAPAAAALADTSTPDVRRLLETLTSQHLLEETTQDRYRFHDLLRVYASERTTAEDPEQDRHTAIQRVLTWYLHTANAADRMLMPHRKRVPLDPPQAYSPPLLLNTRPQALDWCETELANLVAATRQAAQTGHQTIAWQLPVVLWGFFSLRKHWPDWITTNSVGLAAAKDIHHRFGEAYVSITLANAYRDLRRFDEAIISFQHALTIWGEIDCPWEKAAALTLLGMAYLDLRQFEEAIAKLQQALAIFRQVDDPWGEGWALHLLSESNRGLRRFENAIDYAQHALTAFGQIGEQWGEGWSLHDLGQNYRHLRQFEEAIGHFQRALTARREVGDRQGEAVTLRALGATFYDADQVDHARNSWTGALAIFDDLGDPLAAAVRTRLERLNTDNPEQ